MKRLVFFFALIALCTTGKINAQGWGEATCILPDKSQRTIKFYYDMASSSLKRVRIVCSDGDGKKSCVNTNYNKEVIDKVGPHFEGCEIIFPSTFDGYTITAVGHSAFYKCKAKITLPESVTEIEDRAFEDYGYDGYDFALPSKVRYIGKQAFRVAQIKGISLPSSLQNIDDYAFQYSKLEELVLPKSTFVVGSGITYGCNNLQRLAVESGCTNYSTPAGSNVIMDTKQKVVVAGCPTSKIPAEAYRIGNGAFGDIKFVNETVTIPESVGVIGEEAFYWAQFKRLIIKGETVEIGKAAFCHSTMERIDIYGGNVTIGESGFEACKDLLSLWCHSHKPTLTPYKMMSDEGFWEFTGPANRQFSYIGSNVLLYAKYPEEYTEKWDDDILVWQGWFKEVLPLPDEEKTISEIHITDFDWPVATLANDVTATSLTQHANVGNIKYTMFGKDFTDDEPGLNDNVNIHFTITLDDGYTFVKTPKLFVDDTEVTLIDDSSENTSSQKTFVFANYRVPAPPGGVPIKKAFVNVAEPVEGQPLSTTVTAPTGRPYQYAGYTIDNVTWGCVADASLESYDPTKGYTLAAILTAKQDYCFGADCNFTLNGKTASVIRSRTSEGREKVLLAVSYGNEEPVKPDTTYITTLNLTVAEPVEGEVPVAELVSPTARQMEAMGYTIRHIYWQPEDTPYDKSQEFDFRVTLEVTDDYTFFTPDVQVTLNGHTATLYGNPLSYYTSNKDKRCIIDWVYIQSKRGDVNGDGSVNTADVVAVYSYIEKGDASGFSREAADVNNDGSVNTADVVAIYSIIINGSAE